MSDYFFQNAQIAWKGVFRNFRSNGAPIDRKYLNRQRQKIWKIQNDALKVHKKCKNFVPKKTCSDLKPLNNHFRSIGFRPIGFRSNGFRPNGFRPIGVYPRHLDSIDCSYCLLYVLHFIGFKQWILFSKLSKLNYGMKYCRKKKRTIYSALNLFCRKIIQL